MWSSEKIAQSKFERISKTRIVVRCRRCAHGGEPEGEGENIAKLQSAPRLITKCAIEEQGDERGGSRDPQVRTAGDGNAEHDSCGGEPWNATDGLDAAGET